MKRFLILILFSLLFPIQNSSAASPSLEETIEFLVNGAGYNEYKWSIDNCNLTTYRYSGAVKEIIDLNKVDIKSITPRSNFKSFEAFCIGNCRKANRSGGWEESKYWTEINNASWERNKKALDHLYSNFCEGAKSAF